jgi:hypothetical protein
LQYTLFMRHELKLWSIAFLFLCSCGGTVFTNASAADDDGGSGFQTPEVSLPESATPDSGGAITAEASVSVEADAGVPGEDVGSDSSGGGSSGGGSSSGGSGVGCDGSALYDHQVGLDGLTWQDCTPTGTYNAAQALAACNVYAQSVTSRGCVGGCYPSGTTCQSTGNYSDVIYQTTGTICSDAIWDFANTAANGHVQTGGSCPRLTDPAWN